MSLAQRLLDEYSKERITMNDSLPAADYNNSNIDTPQMDVSFFKTNHQTDKLIGQAYIDGTATENVLECFRPRAEGGERGECGVSVRTW